MNGTLPPQNIEVEQSLLCSFLLGDNPEPAVMILGPEDFYKTAHQAIFTAVYSLYKNREPMGSVEILAELKSMGKLAVAGGGVYLAKIMDMPPATNISHHAKIIKEYSHRRKAIEISSRLLKNAYDLTIDFNDLIKTSGENLNALKSGNTRERKLAEEVREYFTLQKGYTDLTDILRTLQILTKEDKNNLYVIINRLVKEGFIEKVGDKRGVYRPIEQQEDDDLDFMPDIIMEHPIKLPFGLNDIVKIFPGNIIVIAGAKSSGKTEIGLKIALANQDRRPVTYLNSEMGKEEFSERMQLLGCLSKKDVRFKAKSRHNNFHDKVDGSDTIYVVDYLEIHDSFYEIAKPIRLIHEKLGQGVCVINVQKDPDAKMGRGGAFSAEKSRLYLNLDFLPHERCSKLSIYDAKACKLNESATGLYKRMKIFRGKIEVLDKDWRRP